MSIINHAPAGRLFGYARVSSTDQDLTIQRERLQSAGCHVVRTEKVSGTTLKGRTELGSLLEFLREGDTLVVTRIDRLARSLKDLQDIIHDLKARGIALKATEQPIDTLTPAGKAFLDMLGVFAEFETNLRRERQLEGIAKAKANGVYQGRKPSIDAARIKALKEAGKSPAWIARELRVARSSVYRALGQESNGTSALDALASG
jgi:DNA invertase Pin-like site-specific DNA recombinase